MGDLTCEIRCTQYSKEGCLYVRSINGNNDPPEPIDLGHPCLHPESHPSVLEELAARTEGREDDHNLDDGERYLRHH